MSRRSGRRGEAMTPEGEKISESPPGTRLAQTGEPAPWGRNDGRGLRGSGSRPIFPHKHEKTPHLCGVSSLPHRPQGGEGAEHLTLIVGIQPKSRRTALHAGHQVVGLSDFEVVRKLGNRNLVAHGGIVALALKAFAPERNEQLGLKLARKR